MAHLLDELEQMAQDALVLGDEYDPNTTHEPQSQEQSIQARYYKPTHTYYVRLEGPVNTPSEVQELGQIPRLPEQVRDDGGTGTDFCVINGSARSCIEHKLHGKFKPTFILINKAAKELARHSWAPYLGKDCSLPQNRLSDVSCTPKPGMTQFPVWYFFYGTLADDQQLHKLLGRANSRYELTPAEVIGGEIMVWAGKYKALVDKPGATATGYAFLVANQDEEDALRVYETNAYEVVRCLFSMQHGTAIHGLTFRYVGLIEELSERQNTEKRHL